MSISLGLQSAAASRSTSDAASAWGTGSEPSRTGRAALWVSPLGLTGAMGSMAAREREGRRCWLECISRTDFAAISSPGSPGAMRGMKRLVSSQLVAPSRPGEAFKSRQASKHASAACGGRQREAQGQHDAGLREGGGICTCSVRGEPRSCCLHKLRRWIIYNGDEHISRTMHGRGWTHLQSRIAGRVPPPQRRKGGSGGLHDHPKLPKNSNPKKKKTKKVEPLLSSYY